MACCKVAVDRYSPSVPRAELGIHGLNRWAVKCLEMSRETRSSTQPETDRARRHAWPSRSLARRIALVQGNARQGPPTLRHQCQLVQDLLSLELNRRLVVKSRLSEIFSAVNASVGPPHFFVISSNLTTINTRTIGSVLTLHRHFHLSPLDPPARKREGSAAGATCSVAQSKREWSISPKWFLAGATLRGWGRASVICFPESVGQGSLVTEHLREVSPLSR